MTSEDSVLQKHPDKATGRPCPDGAVLNIMGEHFPCQQMDQMSVDSLNHDGWAHSNKDAEAIWQGNVVYSQDISNYNKEGLRA